MEDEILSLLSDDNFLERSIDLLAKKLECTSSEKFIQLVKLQFRRFSVDLFLISL